MVRAGAVYLQSLLIRKLHLLHLPRLLQPSFGQCLGNDLSTTPAIPHPCQQQPLAQAGSSWSAQEHLAPEIHQPGNSQLHNSFSFCSTWVWSFLCQRQNCKSRSYQHGGYFHLTKITSVMTGTRIIHSVNCMEKFLYGHENTQTRTGS